MGSDFGSNFDMLIDRANLQDDILGNRLARLKRDVRGPGLKAILSCFQRIGSGGELCELVATLRVCHGRLNHPIRRGTRQFDGDVSHAIFGSRLR